MLIKCENMNNSDSDIKTKFGKLMIICGPNGAPFEQFARSVKIYCLIDLDKT